MIDSYQPTGDPASITATPSSVAVIGASHAAIALADRLRAMGYEGGITLFSDEDHLPYQRPPLSKAWLRGEATGESVLLRDGGYYEDRKIELVTGSRVEHLERTADGVRVAFVLPGGRHVREYDRIVLATGASARRLDLPGADHEGVLVLRGLDDARRLAARVASGPTVVIGGGFIGLEVAATARLLGADVTVVEAGAQLLGRAVGATTAETLLNAHRAMATDVVLGAVPTEIIYDDNGIRHVILADGREVPASTVLIGVGAQPRTELAEQLGVECDNGVVVDADCRASDGWTLAIGDCTVQNSQSGTRYRLESVDNATEQAHAAAAAILGEDRPVRQEPWFWSDQGDQKIQIVGLLEGHTSVIVRRDASKPRRQVALYFSGERLIAAECLNAPADFVALRAAMSRGCRLGPAALSDQSVPLKKLLDPVRVGG